MFVINREDVFIERERGRENDRGLFFFIYS